MATRQIVCHIAVCDLCGTTATASGPDGTRAYVLLDGIGSDDDVRDWTRTAARRLARSAAYHADAETGLRAQYNRYAADPDRQGPWGYGPKAAAIVAVTARAVAEPHADNATVLIADLRP